MVEFKTKAQDIPTERYRHVALLGDSTSLEVYRPGRFEEAKAYWDGKNGIYALKKEVCVMASPPHFAMFASKAFLGSTHDYYLNYREYLPYLKKNCTRKARSH
jgi:hypothetical protein